VDGARAALCDAATEFRARKSQHIAQHPEQRRVGRDVDGHALAVDRERYRHEGLPLTAMNVRTRWARWKSSALERVDRARDSCRERGLDRADRVGRGGWWWRERAWIARIEWPLGLGAFAVRGDPGLGRDRGFGGGTTIARMTRMSADEERSGGRWARGVIAPLGAIRALREGPRDPRDPSPPPGLDFKISQY